MLSEQGALNSPQKVFVWGKTALHWEQNGTACWKTRAGRVHRGLFSLVWLGTHIHGYTNSTLWCYDLAEGSWRCPLGPQQRALEPRPHEGTAKSFLITTSVVVPNALTSEIICNGMEKWSVELKVWWLFIKVRSPSLWCSRERHALAIQMLSWAA